MSRRAQSPAVQQTGYALALLKPKYPYMDKLELVAVPSHTPTPSTLAKGNSPPARQGLKVDAAVDAKDNGKQAAGRQNMAAMLAAFDAELDRLPLNIRRVTAVLPDPLPEGVDREALLRRMSTRAVMKGYNYHFHKSRNDNPSALGTVSLKTPFSIGDGQTDAYRIVQAPGTPAGTEPSQQAAPSSESTSPPKDNPLYEQLKQIAETGSGKPDTVSDLPAASQESPSEKDAAVSPTAAANPTEGPGESAPAARRPCLRAAFPRNACFNWRKRFPAGRNASPAGLPVPHPDLFPEPAALEEAFRAICQRPVLPLEEELSQPDRQALDALILNALLPGQSPAAIHDALLTRVTRRRERARTLIATP